VKVNEKGASTSHSQRYEKRLSIEPALSLGKKCAAGDGGRPTHNEVFISVGEKDKGKPWNDWPDFAWGRLKWRWSRRKKAQEEHYFVMKLSLSRLSARPRID